MTVSVFIASFFAGAAGSMGLGGGGILVLYLVLILSEDQLTTQGINLLFFIPCAAASVAVYAGRKMICFKTVIPMVSGGLCGVWLGIWLTGAVKTDTIGKAFGLLLAAAGLIELFGKRKKSAAN